MTERSRTGEAQWLELPEGTPPELDAARRAGLVAHWRRRAVSEARIGRGFAAIAPRLRALGAPAVVITGCEAAAAEEARHSELCVAMAERYAGGSVAPLDHPDLALPEMAMPDFRTGDERLELSFLIAGTCCINETLAVAYIRACLETADDATAIAANRAHLRDEIGHGRIGWALLASTWIDAELRAALSARLPRLLAANVPLWLRIDETVGPDGEPALGHPSHAALTRAILAAVDEAVIPGFAYVGCDTRAAQAWRTTITSS